jgi:hypothetical protein
MRPKARVTTSTECIHKTPSGALSLCRQALDVAVFACGGWRVGGEGG